MTPMYYIGLDVQQVQDQLLRKGERWPNSLRGSIPATRYDLNHWMKTLPQPWSAAMGATMFAGWRRDVF